MLQGKELDFRPIHSEKNFYQMKKEKKKASEQKSHSRMSQSQVENPYPIAQLSPITSITDQLNKIEFAKKKQLEVNEENNQIEIKEEITNLNIEGKMRQFSKVIEVEVSYHKKTMPDTINKEHEVLIESSFLQESDRFPALETDQSGKMFKKSSVKLPPTPKTQSFYYLSQLSLALKSRNPKNPYYSHFQHNVQSIQYIATLQPLEEDDFIEKKVYLPPKRNEKFKTLVLDLDETLVHCDEDLSRPHDLKIPIKFTGGEVVQCGVTIRPFAKKFLELMNKHYEIVIFTASHACYANIILNLLDPKNQYITYRMFRDSCIETEEGIFIKDLRVFANRSLDELVLVDNAFYSFGFQLDNGVPIVPFFRDKEDVELQELHDFLVTVKNEKSIKNSIRTYFRNDLYTRFMDNPGILEKALLDNIESLKLF